MPDDRTNAPLNPRFNPPLNPPTVRRPGEQTAGRLLLVIVGALVLACLVNADALVRRAENKPLGAGRDRSLYLWHPMQDISHVTQLNRLRTLGDHLAGNKDGGDGLVATAPARRTTRPSVRPHLRSPTRRDPLRIYVGGDSVVRDAGESFLRLADGDKRLRTALHFEIATGLSRPDRFDWRATLIGDAEALKPEVAILMFGGNDAQGIVGSRGEVYPTVDSPGWRTEYARRVAAVMDSLATRNRLIFWIGQPPMRSETFDRHIQVINSIVREQAHSRVWMSYVDTSRLLGDSTGRYTDRLPGIDQDLRQDDGIHLSRAGADLLARHLLDIIDHELAAAPEGPSR